LDGQSQDLRREWQVGNTSLHLDEVVSPEGGSMLRRTFTLEGFNRAVLVGALSGKLKINGQEVSIAGYHDWFSHHTLDISAYICEGINEIEMAYSKSPLERLELIAYSSEKELKGWHIANAHQLEREDAALEEGVCAGKPVWHTVQFAKPALPADVNAKLKLRLTGMSKGVVWLNGKDLGRYWQIGPQEDYKIPMAWLEDRNELVLFDEAGVSAASIRLLYDSHSHRRWVPIG
jgi:hypothetical protein